MGKFNFRMGLDVRAYGDVEIEAATVEDAVAMLTPDYVTTHIVPRETTWDDPRNLSIIQATDESPELYEAAARAAGWSIGTGKFDQPIFVTTLEGGKPFVSAADPNDWENLCFREGIEIDGDIPEWSQIDLPQPALPSTISPEHAARRAELLLREARDLLKHAGATRAVDRVRLAIKSAGGAVRHAQSKAVRAEHVGRVSDHDAELNWHR